MQCRKEDWSAQEHDFQAGMKASTPRPHTARAVGQHLANLGIVVLPWTSKSPDLNPIEHIWDELERRLRARQQEPATLAELKYPRRRMGGQTPGASAAAHRVNAGAVWRRRGC